MFPLFLLMISGATIHPMEKRTCDVNICLMRQEKMSAENFMLTTPIKYSLWWNGPEYYDCGGIVTEALRQEGYIGKKIHSRFLKCRKPNNEAKTWDVLINQNDDDRHVALITSDYDNGVVEILDYVARGTVASYRSHTFYDNIFTLDKTCLLSLKSYEPL